MMPETRAVDRERLSSLSNFSLVVPYAAPYAAYVLIAGIAARLPAGIGYALRLLVVGGLLAWAWRWYLPLTGARSVAGSTAWGILAGTVGIPLWVLLVAPFGPPAGIPWSGGDILLRLAAAVLVVPLAEELLLRGYVLRLALQWLEERRRNPSQAFHRALFERSLNEPGRLRWSWAAVLISSAAFALGHQPWEWAASLVYGVLMCTLLVGRQDLLSCVVAHGTTNLGLGLYVWWTGSWQYW